MSRRNPHPHVPSPEHPPPHIVVVDSHLHDYLCLANLVHDRAIRMTFLSSGGAALRVVDRMPDAMWLVHTHPPDVDGLHLVEMLLDVVPNLSVYLVDDAADAAREEAAWRAGVSHYLCKPVDPQWITAWRGKQITPVHATPATTVAAPTDDDSCPLRET